MIWYDIMLYDIISCDTIWCDMIWYDMKLYDMILFYMIWYLLWYDIIWPNRRNHNTRTYRLFLWCWEVVRFSDQYYNASGCGGDILQLLKLLKYIYGQLIYQKTTLPALSFTQQELRDTSIPGCTARSAWFTLYSTTVQYGTIQYCIVS